MKSPCVLTHLQLVDRFSAFFCATKNSERCTTTAPIYPLHLASCQVLLTNDRTAFVDPNDGRGLSYEPVVQIGPDWSQGSFGFSMISSPLDD